MEYRRMEKGASRQVAVTGKGRLARVVALQVALVRVWVLGGSSSEADSSHQWQSLVLALSTDPLRNRPIRSRLRYERNS